MKELLLGMILTGIGIWAPFYGQGELGDLHLPFSGLSLEQSASAKMGLEEGKSIEVKNLGRRLKIVTLVHRPLYRSFPDARHLCEQIAGQWRLASDHDLFSLRDYIRTQKPMLSQYVSKTRYWAQGSSPKAIHLTEGDALSAELTTPYGVVCTSAT